MKRILLSIALLCSLVCNAQTYTYDVNGDGNVSIEDVTYIVNHLLGKANPGEPDAVDLGLPSGTLWATHNVGAEKPEDYGLYFAWGETTGYTYDNTDRTFDWTSYVFCDGTSSTMTKYCTHSSSGTLDNKTELEAVDDAATVAWGSDWQTPSYDQIMELYNSSNTTSEWTTLNGVNVRKITSKSNGNSIYLPFASYWNGATIDPIGYSGSYWSRSLNTNVDISAFTLDVNTLPSGIGWGQSHRCWALSVRPVRVLK